MHINGPIVECGYLKIIHIDLSVWQFRIMVVIGLNYLLTETELRFLISGRTWSSLHFFATGIAATMSVLIGSISDSSSDSSSDSLSDSSSDLSVVD